MRSRLPGRYVPLNPVVLSSTISCPNRSIPHGVGSFAVGGNSDLLESVARLWISSDDIVVDVTYGRGVFWRKLPGLPHHRFDLLNGDDLRKLPLDDESVDVLVLDPPYRPTHGSSSPRFDENGMMTRYGNGTQNLDSINDVLDLYTDGIIEAMRVLRIDGRLLVKCQDMSYSNRLHLVTLDVLRATIEAGFHFADQFILGGGSGLKSPSWINQERARRTHSVLWVVVKLGDDL